jgi:hypothetical protein
MTVYATFKEFAQAHPVGAGHGTATLHHNVFVITCHELMAQEYSCWAAISQYRQAPSKRRALFISDHWLAPADGKVNENRTQSSIFDPINTGSKESTAFNKPKQEALTGKIAGIRSVKTWQGKLSNWGERKKLGGTPADLFNDVETVIFENFHDIYRPGRQTLNDALVRQLPKFYGDLQDDRRILTESNYSPDAMGIW